MGKVLIVAGARPNFMKIAPIVGFLRRGRIASGRAMPAFRLVHTGQHYDDSMSAVFFRELGIPDPDFHLEVGSGSHAKQTADVMVRFEPVCISERPDWVVVVGDVNSTVACTLVSAKLGIRVAHVEAGLRSFDRTMPEEVNRIVTDALADLLLTPSDDADVNLRREGVPESRIVRVGNVMIDSLLRNLDAARRSSVLDRVGVKAGQFVYATLHRPANVDTPSALKAIVASLEAAASTLPVVFPVHPRTRRALEQHGLSAESTLFRLVDPVGYHDSLKLTEDARVVVTDSGGLQEEATYFRTPCLTLRPNTERPITITLGSNRLSTAERLSQDLEAVLAGPRRIGQIPPLWDGRTAERIVEALLA